MEMIDEKFMREALALAQQAEELDEVPIGAVIVSDGKIVGCGYNKRETGKDATLHAEMIAIREACATLGGWRIPNATLYVTLEPCPMCAGAILNARIDRVVYGAPDSKSGACGGRVNIMDSDLCNHSCNICSGILQDECSSMIKAFFSRRRSAARNQKNKTEE